MNKPLRIVLLGATGFVGTHLVSMLSQLGHHSVLLTRGKHRNNAAMMLPRVTLRQTTDFSAENLANYLTNADVAINLIGILKGSTAVFEQAHVQITQNLLEACKQQGVTRYLHMSALGADENSPSVYAQTKAQAEKYAHEKGQEAGIAVTSFRPSVIFGIEDQFINRFASILHSLLPVVPLPVPQAQLQPVFVGDVATVMTRALTDSATFGQSYDLAGSEIYRLLEIVRNTASWIGINPKKVKSLSDAWSLRLTKLPIPLFTREQYELLQVPNITENNGMDYFAITPVSIENIMQPYLQEVYVGRPMDHYRATARRG